MPHRKALADAVRFRREAENMPQASDDGKILVRKLTAVFDPLNGGNEQKPQLQLNGDELKLIDLNSGVTGGRVEQTYRRAK
jgi:hypothetical protein